MFAFFTIRSKYFERSDFLKPVSLLGNENNEHSQTSLLNKGLGRNLVEQEATQRISPWDIWMAKNKQMQSIGDIWNKCGMY